MVCRQELGLKEQKDLPASSCPMLRTRALPDLSQCWVCVHVCTCLCVCVGGCGGHAASRNKVPSGGLDLEVLVLFSPPSPPEPEDLEGKP